MAQGRLRIENIRAGVGGRKPPTRAFPDVCACDLLEATRTDRQELLLGYRVLFLAGLLAPLCPHAAWWAQQLPRLLMACSEKWSRR